MSMYMRTKLIGKSLNILHIIFIGPLIKIIHYDRKTIWMSKCKVASLLWFAHFDMRIGEGAQLLSCSHVVDHTSIPLIFT